MIEILPVTRPGLPVRPPARPAQGVTEVFRAEIRCLLAGKAVVSASRGVRLLRPGQAALYFLPPSSLDVRYVRRSDTLRLDDIGLAVHLHLAAGGQVARDGAWYYPGPDPELALVAGMVCIDPSRFTAVTMDGCAVLQGTVPGNWRVPPCGGQFGVLDGAA